MSEHNPCLNCGACCGFFRVSFFWGECESSGGLVPDDLVVQINPTRVAMIGTDSKPCRCIGLEGEIGKGVSCSLYEKRSTPCREFEAAWVDGQPNPSCDAARAAYGLTPLEANEPIWPDDGAEVA
ncbi:YkgJ family cysteine cluster protein [Pseudomonas sp. P66]|jgi:Fe-S-cluster containining protein|uniref:YkgJ family cysteine cluster protein n=1 Tax=Pseudomonas arcuscaelestis TaxID=2710591 RepID=A0ABS2C0K4_9PSED|nr:YkgJ family cysteine cluster protein [Pseudomonas arcuscaelestis]MBM3107552.1 YkgJ family cysteine cluster protein [Pseudomonas arcuscaelestis]MBM3113904.1 YkgJ family cysteine cluster protein [Pseudomonas arcuscaelestis]MBM5459405.1 YkgJ family cysteine cluster protein [Pseudomonas arcuscaelestis]